jgi:signal transduction histidine kinase
MDAMSTEDLMQMRVRIDKSLDNLTELINNILEWSMTSSRKRKWTFDKINTTDIINKNITLYQSIAESKGVNIIYQPHDELVCYGDYYAVDTVVRNLLSNSIKFSHAHKDVIISVTKTSGKILISVKDHGIGIPLDIQGKLFALNANITQPGTNNEKGSGLGLILCKELVKENNGDIQVKSKPNEGSEFIVSLPEYNADEVQLSVN